MSPNLDLLRTIAVAFVVAWHMIPKGSDLPPLSLGAFGRVGVILFFVHTAYVLMQSLERNGESPIAFYVRRAFRILPLSVVMVLLLAGPRFLGGEVSGAALLSNLLLMQNITGHASIPAVLWTLPYEIQMYAVLPALFLIAKGARSSLRIALLWLMSVAAASSGAFPLLEFVPCFMAGVFAYTVRGPRVLSPLILFGCTIAASVVVSLLWAAGWAPMPLQWAISALVGLLLPFTRELQSSVVARLSAWCAKYSYSIYLTHMMTIALTFYAFDLPYIVECALFLMVLVIIVRTTYRWIEAPGIALGKRLADRLTNEKAPPAAMARGVNDRGAVG